MGYVVDVLTLAAILVIAVQGYMLIKGLGGLLHLGHAVFYGLGAYGAAIAATKLLPPGSFLLSVPIGGLVAAAGAFLVGLPALRGRGRYFMIVTFAIQLIFVTLVINLGFTGGPDGISAIPGVSLGPWRPHTTDTVSFGLFALPYPQVKLLVMWALAVLSFFACRRLILSPYGRLVRAVRDDEHVAEAYGREAAPVKMSILVIGAGLTGAAGALFAHHFNYVGPTQFEIDTTIFFLVMLIVGGQYSLFGASLGAVLMVGLLELLRYLLESVIVVPFEMTAHLRQVVFAVTLILVLTVRSGGLFPERLPRHRRPAGLPPVLAVVDGGKPPAAADARDSTEAPLLTCRGLAKSFGGVVAVADASLDLHPGKIVAIIGPNGAGKTSTFNILSGFETADAGKAAIRGRSIIGLTAAEIARLGLARTFQDVRVWPRLSAIENILVSSLAQPGTNPLRWFGQPRRSGRVEAANVARAWRLLERFGLQDHANHPASQLSYAQRKMLSLARISSFAPDVMLLDEPTSGVDPRKLGTFLAHIRAFAVADRAAVCLIEHNMTVVRELADRVIFMDDGKVIATGTPAEILGDAHLMRTYLGHREMKVA
jgi:branched-chain amino acid transport system permease protein